MRLKRYFVALCCMVSLCFGCGESPKKQQQAGTPGDKIKPGVGLSLLAVQNETYGCEWLKAYDDLPTMHLALLWGSFGDRSDCLSRFLKDERPKVLNVYLENGSCRRKGNCSERDSGNPFEYIPRRASEVIEFVNKHAVNTKLILTIGLEDNHLHINAEYFCEQIKRRHNEIQVWRNPVSANYLDHTNCFDGYELHHQEREADTARFRIACSYSNDGYDLKGIGAEVWTLPHRIDRASLLTEIRDRKRDCISYIWSARASNCLTVDSGQAPAPHARRCTIDSNIFTNLNDLLKEANNGH